MSYHLLFFQTGMLIKLHIHFVSTWNRKDISVAFMVVKHYLRIFYIRKQRLDFVAGTHNICLTQDGLDLGCGSLAYRAQDKETTHSEFHKSLAFQDNVM